MPSIPAGAPAWLAAPPERRSGRLAADGLVVEWSAEPTAPALTLVEPNPEPTDPTDPADPADPADPTAIDVADRPVAIQLSRSLERGEGLFAKERHRLHAELRAGQVRHTLTATGVASSVVAGLPWQERQGVEVDPGELRAMVAAMASIDAFEILGWRQEDTIDPDARALVAGSTPAPPGGRPGMGTWSVFSADWSTATFFLCVFPLFFATPLFVVAGVFGWFEVRYATAGDERVAVILGKDIEQIADEDGTETNYLFDVEVELDDGSTARVEVETDQSTYEAHRTGEPIDVVVLFEDDAGAVVEEARVAGEDLMWLVWLLAGIGMLVAAFPAFNWWRLLRRSKRAGQLMRYGRAFPGALREFEGTNVRVNNVQLVRPVFEYGGHVGRTGAVHPSKVRSLHRGDPILVFYDPDDPDEVTWERPMTAAKARVESGGRANPEAAS